jgi:hypothetical protein
LDEFIENHPLDKIAVEFSNSPYGRGFPATEDLTGNQMVAKMLRKLLKEFKIAAHEDEYKTAISICHQRGWTFADLEGNGIRTYRLASPIHTALLSWLLEPPEKELGFGSLLDLVKEVVSSFKPSQLFAAVRRSEQNGEDALAPEIQYQQEFYRAIHDVTDGGVCISPEFASAQTAKVAGRIDFFIKKNMWGIKLTREGTRLKEHSDRFKTSGAYGAWIENGRMADYILLDCRTTEPNIKYQSEWSLIVSSY